MVRERRVTKIRSGVEDFHLYYWAAKRSIKGELLRREERTSPRGGNGPYQSWVFSGGG